MGLDQSGDGYRCGDSGFHRQLQYQTMDIRTMWAANLVFWMNYSGNLEGACLLCLSVFLLMNICYGDCGSGGRAGCPMNEGLVVQIIVFFGKTFNLNCSQWGWLHLGGSSPQWCGNGWTRGHCKVLWCTVMVLQKCYVSAVHCGGSVKLVCHMVLICCQVLFVCWNQGWSCLWK